MVILVVYIYPISLLVVSLDLVLTSNLYGLNILHSTCNVILLFNIRFSPILLPLRFKVDKQICLVV